jgi:hypothetical protein
MWASIDTVLTALMLAFGGVFGAAAAVRILLQFRGLLLPALPAVSGSRLRHHLRIHSYLPRWLTAGVFVAGWGIGVGGGYGVVLVVDLLPELAQILVAVPAFLLISVYVALAYHWYGRARKTEQTRLQLVRDRRAVEVMVRVHNAGADVPAFSLWLRPFTSTGRVWVVNKSRPVKLGHESDDKFGYHVEFADLETLLAMVVEPVAPLIALGASGEQVGAGRVTTAGTEWQEAFLVLATAADMIFLLPASNPGTSWETEQLLLHPDWLDKCVFVLPPAYSVTDRVRADFIVAGARRVPEIDRLRAAGELAREHEISAGRAAPA